ncbi:MAG: hypothetical protein WBF53_03095 [Litorimonas sp.]
MAAVVLMAAFFVSMWAVAQSTDGVAGQVSTAPAADVSSDPATPTAVSSNPELPLMFRLLRKCFPEIDPLDLAEIEGMISEPSMLAALCEAGQVGRAAAPKSGWARVADPAWWAIGISVVVGLLNLLYTHRQLRLQRVDGRVEIYETLLGTPTQILHAKLADLLQRLEPLAKDVIDWPMVEAALESQMEYVPELMKARHAVENAAMTHEPPLILERWNEERPDLNGKLVHAFIAEDVGVPFGKLLDAVFRVSEDRPESIRLEIVALRESLMKSIAEVAILKADFRKIVRETAARPRILLASRISS